MRLPSSGITCPNCGCDMRGTPCDVCGYIRRRPAEYPIGHDKLTDSYTRPIEEPIRGRYIDQLDVADPKDWGPVA